MKEIFGRFFAILLIGLILIKVSAFHVYEHHDSSDASNDHCELCVLTIEGQQTENLVPPSIVINFASLEILSQPTLPLFDEGHLNALEEGILFCRPPPHPLA